MARLLRHSGNHFEQAVQQVIEQDRFGIGLRSRAATVTLGHGVWDVFPALARMPQSAA
ncbi:hypothetical protein JQ624_06115 [Bradyrhizobium sp. AUGA SZCCT0283]|nr:hypothetical protein [Bradyrhizobium sp. AUGA SZCCT0283]